MAVNQKAVKVLNKVLEAGFTDEKAISAKDNIDVYLNLLPMKWSYTVAKASKKAVASEWNISEASLPMSVKIPTTSLYGIVKRWLR